MHSSHTHLVGGLCTNSDKSQNMSGSCKKGGGKRRRRRRRRRREEREGEDGFRTKVTSKVHLEVGLRVPLLSVDEARELQEE